MSQTHELTFTRTISAPPAEIWRAFTQATLLRDWLCDAAAVDPRPGGYLFLHWNGAAPDGSRPGGYSVTGTYTRTRGDAAGGDETQAEEGLGVRMTWQGSGDPGPTHVRLVCRPEGKATLVFLVHGGLGEGPEWAAQAQRWAQEWPSALENLQSVLETGLDLRQVRRPRLGIWMNEFTPEAAARIGAPVKEGVLLEGTVEGSGAAAAGLQKDDVLVSLNGVALAGPHSFDQALRGLKAGDRPQVEYYRGAEKHLVPLELGHFPVPDLPDNPVELAARVRAAYAEEMQTLRAQLSGVSEAQAARRPAGAEEWSALEIVAHLILTERDYQGWVADMLNDTPVNDDLLMSPNVTPRIQALAARIPRLESSADGPGLLDELTQTLEETAAMLAALPDSFARERKHLYRRAAYWALEDTPSHFTVQHKEQIDRALGR